MQNGHNKTITRRTKYEIINKQNVPCDNRKKEDFIVNYKLLYYITCTACFSLFTRRLRNEHG